MVWEAATVTSCTNRVDRSMDIDHLATTCLKVLYHVYILTLAL